LSNATVLADTNIWISYFRANEYSDTLVELFESDRLVINDVILAELIPALNLSKNQKTISHLRKLKRLPVFVNWEGIIEAQTKCLSKGINGIGLPDLMIAQSAVECSVSIFTNDKNLRNSSDFLNFKLFDPQ